MNTDKKLFSDFIMPVADLYAYCLMNNHFHLMIQIKEEKKVFEYFKLNGKFPEETISLQTIKELSNGSGFDNFDILGMHLSKQFSNFFNAYAKAINEQEKRRGSLFEKAYKRKILESDDDKKECLIYIHSNPVHHKITESIEDWKYSSYMAYITDRSTKVKREEGLSWFENKENFIYCHNEKLEKIVNAI